MSGTPAAAGPSDRRAAHRRGRTWKDALAGRIPEQMAEEIDIYEGQIVLRKQGKIDEKVFAETRLRRGAYGQRYDNGQRHDGEKTQELRFPCGDLTKGPETVWDAPGMQRIKIPYGGMSPDQMDTLAALAEERSDAICHITTRQDIQLHYVHIDDTPDLMRRLAAVGITTREACGNSVRNVTGCPLAGVCHDEPFDISPYAQALMRFLLGHPDVQDFGRKFKPAFSGCAQHACGLVIMHDIGYVAEVREVDGRPKRGFTVYVGGGLGPVPHQAKVLEEFVGEEELLPITQAVARVYSRLGEKKNRNKARIKFLVAKLGIEEFRRLVREERKTLPHDERWTAYLDEMPQRGGQPLKDAVPLRIDNGNRDTPGSVPDGFAEWYETNVYKQRQAGYAVATVALPLGDITSDQMRQLADVARKHVGDNVRTTVEQNIVLRWVSEGDLPALYADLKAIGLAEGGAGTVVDITACPATDTCKLGIASSRGLAAELRTHLAARSAALPRAIEGLKIKISGCFNSCGQHHISDIGFYGNSRKVGGYAVPHFQVVLGGQWDENAGSYGLALGSVPSKAIPKVVDALAQRYVEEREKGERFQGFVRRLGRKEMKEMLKGFTHVPNHAEAPTFYTDWGDPREFTIGDMGVGECAGEVVSLFEIEIVKAESQAFDALVALDEGNPHRAYGLAYRAMLDGARALVRTEYTDVSFDPDDIVAEFRKRFFDTERFFDKFVKGKFGQFLFDRHENPVADPDEDTAHRTVEQAQLFIDACHACDAREAGAVVGGAKV